MTRRASCGSGCGLRRQPAHKCVIDLHAIVALMAGGLAGAANQAVRGGGPRLALVKHGWLVSFTPNGLRLVFGQYVAHRRIGRRQFGNAPKKSIEQ
jgi:hypothetical protein